MAEMQTQIKIESNASEAAKKIDTLNKAFGKTGEQVAKVGESLELVDKESAKATEGLARAAKEAEKLARAEGIKKFSKEIDRIGSAASAVGRQMSLAFTAPFAALAGLSLKSLLDTSSLENASAPAKELAASVNGLKENFRQLSLEIGSFLVPMFLKITSFLNNAIDRFRSLDSVTKGLVLTFAGIAASIGPALIMFGQFATVISKLPIVLGFLKTAFTAVFGVLTSPITLLVTLGATLAGLVNVFFKLREAGVSTAEALSKSFNLWVTGFNNFVTRPILNGISYIMKGLSKLAGAFDKDLGESISRGANIVKEVGDSWKGDFDTLKADIDKDLAKIGSSAGKAFSFGMIDEAKNLVSMFDMNIGKPLEQKVEQTFSKAEQYAKTFSSGVGSAFGDVASGAKNLGDAFNDFARGFVQRISEMIIEAIVFESVMKSIKGFGGSFADGKKDGGPVGRFASGGFVSGPGGPRDDKIPAWLSNGEYVINARSVKKLGLGFLNSINSLGALSGGARLAYANHFADGGMVESAAQAPQVVIENKGSDKQVTQTSFDPKSTIITVVLDDLNKNGPMIKGIASTLGMKRGGFR